jgi:5-methylthioadenosine/S-adenosylhomocysteine deaminase
VQSEVPTLISARWVIPVEPSGVVLEHHSVAVTGGAIEAVLPTPEALAAFPGHARIDLPDHALIPGLVNLHTHAAMTLMRGMADDLPLMRWLQEHIWPAESKHVSPQFVRDGTMLACAEMLRGGITCFNDMYFYPEAAVEAALSCGMRASLGMIVIDFPTAYASDPDDYLAKGLALRDRYRDHPLLSFCLAPHAPYTVSDVAFGKIEPWPANSTARSTATSMRPRKRSSARLPNTACARSSACAGSASSGPTWSRCTRSTCRTTKSPCLRTTAARWRTALLRT